MIFLGRRAATIRTGVFTKQNDSSSKKDHTTESAHGGSKGAGSNQENTKSKSSKQGKQESELIFTFEIISRTSLLKLSKTMSKTKNRTKIETSEHTLMSYHS